ncbi:enoyl-CoA hydratase [Litorivivens lipolytica]|uniref:Enoyl-CoA hydratase n=1 Tax=Litorivivens lipolytica TaxID=1524264 RepID=A0A7W4Z6H4_9GAMM|nr:crotonase/enoyl-CoA hydratase family protein [Litorivivens lipolytica]MBB3046906.1 enoyl-CoA hydratase [Litorivivens lipolytica]
MVDYETHNDVAIITLNRPDFRNAIDTETGVALFEAVQRFESDDALRVAVLTGAGGHFCAGADLKALNNDVSWNPDFGHGPLGPTWHTPSKPVIAAVEGYAVAGGLELALWCDLRVAADSAVFGVFCRRWGVPLIDGGTVRLPRLIGESRAMDMILTGRSVDAEEAFSIGLANRRCADGTALSTALAMAEQIASSPQACMLSDRRCVQKAAGQPFNDAMAIEGKLGWDYLQSRGFADGVARFVGGAGRHGEGS